MTVTKFNADKQAAFRVAIAAVAAGVSSADVTIENVESISGARRKEETRDASRHLEKFGDASRHLLSAADIRVDMSVKAASQNAADALVQKLTITTINSKLQQVGLPAATLLDAAEIAPSGEGGSTSNEAASVICSQPLLVLPLDLWSFW